MSICNGEGEKVESHAAEAWIETMRDAIRDLDEAGTRRFLVNLLHGCGLTMERVAKVMRCSVATVRREGKLPAMNEAEG